MLFRAGKKRYSSCVRHFGKNKLDVAVKLNSLLVLWNIDHNCSIIGKINIIPADVINDPFGGADNDSGVTRENFEFLFWLVRSAEGNEGFAAGCRNGEFSKLSLVFLKRVYRIGENKAGYALLSGFGGRD